MLKEKVIRKHYHRCTLIIMDTLERDKEYHITEIAEILFPDFASCTQINYTRTILNKMLSTAIKLNIHYIVKVKPNTYVIPSTDNVIKRCEEERHKDIERIKIANQDYIGWPNRR